VDLILFVVGLCALVLGAEALMRGASRIAGSFGISPLVVGLTIVAAGTSFPELATSMPAAIRGQTDIVVGNVVGSNLFNILGVLGVSAVAAPDGLPVSSQILAIDLPVMVAVAIACLPIFFTGNRIDRWEGRLFPAFYIAYSAHIVMMAAQHEWMREFNGAMVFFVLPLTTITLLILAARHWRAR
jgi:cation:H+ antiporter